MNKKSPVALLATAALAGALSVAGPVHGATHTSTVSSPVASPGSSPGSPIVSPAVSSAVAFREARAAAPRVVRESGRRGMCRWSTGYPVFRGAGALTTALRTAVESRREAFLDGATSRFCPEGAWLRIHHEVLAAGDGVVGVRLVTRVDAAGDGTSTRTYWYDGKAGRVGTIRLLRPGSDAALGRLVERGLAGRTGIDRARLAAAFRRPATHLTDVSFTGSGGLRLHFDRGAVAVPPAGAVEVTVGAAQVTPLLSDFGRRARHQSIHAAGVPRT